MTPRQAPEVPAAAPTAGSAAGRELRAWAVTAVSALHPHWSKAGLLPPQAQASEQASAAPALPPSEVALAPQTAALPVERSVARALGSVELWELESEVSDRKPHLALLTRLALTVQRELRLALQAWRAEAAMGTGLASRTRGRLPCARSPAEKGQG
jgi:hypothetical protein